MNYNYLDLFSGIGGFPLGAYWAGMKFKNHFCSDAEPYVVKLYKKRFPDSIQLGDIKAILFSKLKRDYPGEWIITGGFPCQDISIAGKGKGLIDEKGNKTRSGLWFEMLKGIRILRPRFVFIENVRALLNRGLETVLANLADIGYDAEWQIISAEDMGAPHKRERVWIVAYPNSIIKSRGISIRKSYKGAKVFVGRGEDGVGPRNEMVDTGSNPQGTPHPQGVQQLDSNISQIRKEGGNDSGDCSSTLANAKSKRARGISDQSKKKGAQSSNELSGECSGIFREISDTSKPRLQRQEPEERNRRKSRLSAQRSGWKPEPDVGRLAHGISHKVDRLKGLGNAIIPQIAELLFNQIKNYL